MAMAIAKAVGIPTVQTRLGHIECVLLCAIAKAVGIPTVQT
jgi:hypothetical protein